MIIRIAFKNIWRNKLRSWVVIVAIALGIFGGLAVIATATGLTKMRQDNAIKTYVSHVQVHNPDYLKYGRITDRINASQSIIDYLANNSKIEAYSSRLRIECFAQSAGGTTGILLNGVDAENESKLTTIAKTSEHQNFLKNYKRKLPMVISKKLAERLNAKVGTSIQVSYTDVSGLPGAAGFKVVDIYSTSNSMYDEVNAFVRIEHLQELVKTDGIHEIALTLKKDSEVESFKEELQAKYPGSTIESWRSVAPELGYADKMMDLVMTLFLGIIMLALAFGIVNTMLMAVLERKKELGMLLSVGMNKRKVFWMIVWESIFLALIAGPLGILASYGAVSFFGRSGIDLSFAAEGLASVGLGSTIYPILDSKFYLIISVLVILTAILSCIYPAYKALKLNPAETLRTAV